MKIIRPNGEEQNVTIGMILKALMKRIFSANVVILVAGGLVFAAGLIYFVLWSGTLIHSVANG